MGKMSKTKGNSFERKIAKRLTKWAVDSDLDVEFNRVPGSGSLRWHEQYKNVIGDITCSDDTFKNTIECKNREDWKHKQFIEIGEPCKSGLYSWWEQSCDEAQRADKWPWLILKKNHCKELLIFSSLETLIFETIDYDKMVMGWLPTFKDFGWNSVGIVLLETFLEALDPGLFIRSKD